MDEGILDKWRALVAKWREKKPKGDYVDAKSPHGAAKPKDRSGVYVTPDKLSGGPMDDVSIAHAMSKVNDPIPHLNYEKEPNSEGEYEKKAAGEVPPSRELTDFEGARTMTKWEDDEAKGREERFKKDKEEFDAIKAVQPTLDISIYHPGKKIRNLKENIKIIIKKSKKCL